MIATGPDSDVDRPAAKPVARVLVLAATTGYQTRSFGDAAARQGIDLMFATDRCHALDDPWRDGAVAIKFHEEEESLRTILAAVEGRPVDGVLALGDRPTVMASRVAAALHLPGNLPRATRAARNKHLAKRAWAAAGLPVPWRRAVRLDADLAALAQKVSYPCVVKPLALSGSRGVMRVDDPTGFVAAFERLRRLLSRPDVRSMRDAVNQRIGIEGYIDGPEYAIEGLFERGRFRTLAVFDKPDPLDGPFFEETLYVTPSRAPEHRQRAMIDTIERAARALGLCHGPVHAECRAAGDEIYPLEVAARPIGGLCARVLKFGGPGQTQTLEDLVLRHAAGMAVDDLTPSRPAAGVMMLPIPRRGFFKGLEGVEDALAVSGIDELRVTAKQDQLLEPLPEGSSYLGFLFASGESPALVETALRTAHGRLRVKVSEAPVLLDA